MPQIVVPIANWIGSVVAGAAAAAGAGFVTAAYVGAVAAIVAEVAIYAGLSAIADDLSRQKIAPMGQELQLRVNADVAREMIVGVRLHAGTMVARYSRGSNLYNAHFVYQVADHPCTELSKVFAEGRIVQSSPLAHGVRTEITAYSYSGGGRVWMTWHDGRPGQTYDADLVTKSAQDPDVVAGTVDGWTTAHVGAGCAYIHVEVQWDSDILTSIPQFLFQVKGAAFYDRRKDTTAGGSGSHRLDDPATWEYTTNAAVVTDHYMLGYQVEADPLAFGLGLSKIEVPYATFEALADLADEDVTTGTGGAVEVIKRYAINAIISTAEAFETVLENFQNQMSARIVDLGGRIGILGGEARTATVTLTDADWAHDESVRYADKLPFSSLFGAVIGSFPDPGNMYQPTPYDRQTTPYLQLPDGGEAQTAQLDLPMETHPRRAVRLAAAWVARESLQPRLAGVFATRSLAWKLEAGDWFELTSERLQVTAAKFEVIDTIKYEDFTVAMTARAIDPDFLAFSVDDDPDLSVPPAVDPAILLLDIPEFDVEDGTVTAGAVVEPCIVFTLTSDETIAREIVIEYGVADPAWDPMTDPQEDALIGSSFVSSMHVSQILTKIRAGVMPSTDYLVRAKAKAGLRESPWTDWAVAISTGSTYSVGGAATVPWSGVVDDDTNRPADNADVTGVNVAAGIAGQAPAATDSTIQAGATKNTLTFGSSAPSSPTNGDIWVDTTTTPYLIKTRVSGAWQTSGSYGGVFGGTLYETAGGVVATVANYRTSSGTAAAIAAQGDLATANRASLPFGVNALTNTEFALSTSYPPLGYSSGAIGNLAGVTQTASIVTAGPRRAVKSVMTGTVSSGSYFDLMYGPIGDLAAARRFLLPVVAGDVVGASALLAKNSAVSAIYVSILWLDAAGAYLTESGGNSITANANGDTGNPADYALSQVAATAPTNARYAAIDFRCLTSASAVNPTGWAMSPMLCRLAAGQTVVPVYTPGALDRTADNTAGNVSSGIAAQGTQATANHQRGTSYSGTPTEGSWWSDTSTNKLKLYTGGAWQIVADIAATAITATFSPTSVSYSAAGSGGHSDAITVTPSGGSGSYTYQWFVSIQSYTGASTLKITSGATSATCTVAGTFPSGGDIDGRLYCVITDTDGAQVTKSIAVSYSSTS